jgi:hypothetical protein
MSTPHDTDIALWAEEQAQLLRRRAELANNDELDWLHLAEEIEGVVEREARGPLATGTDHPAPVEVAAPAGAALAQLGNDVACSAP